MKINKILFLVVFLIAFGYLKADVDSIDIGIDEQLGAKLPLQTEFYNEFGDTVTLAQLINKPTVLTFVYYNCPGICTPLMNAMADVFNRSDLKPGEDYEVVSISMDEYETPPVAADKKEDYIKSMKVNFPDSAWHFLTGDSANIKRIADVAGFHFKREGDQFRHTGALIFVTENGKITRYLFPEYRNHRGFSILPFDFKMAITETAEGKEVPTMARVLQYCFSYDPEGDTYVLNVTRIFGAGIIILAAAFVIFISVKPKKDKKKNSN